MPAKKTTSRARKPAPPAKIAASFEYSGPRAGGVRNPIWLDTRGGTTLIDSNKGRNNYYKMRGSLQASICRRMVERNWFLSTVIPRRVATTIAGFDCRDADGVSMRSQYDFLSLVSDILHEDLTTSNVVCMWRKGEDLPTITTLDMESVEYAVSGGIERITITYEADAYMAKDTANAAFYKKALGEDMYKAISKGGPVTIVKGEKGDKFWDFEVMGSGKRRGVFMIPELVPILDVLDFLELMGVGDWNIAWFRKDIIRQWKKGYPVKNGAGAGVNSVDITKGEIKELGEGGAAINGASNIPMNHDVEASYLTTPADSFDAKQVKAAIDKLLQFGGMEAVVLLGSFSQQNGAAPSLMHISRITALARRARVEGFLARIFSAEEFSSLDWKTEPDESGRVNPKFHWSVKSLYSMEELLAMVGELNDGTASTQTRREILDLDNEQEVSRLIAEHANRQGYAPPFEAGQALLPAMFPDELAPAGAAVPPPAAKKTAKKEAGRTAKIK